tara:strand:- start:1407 stop:2441 length:1035 start_codon:yes stop_codon:yes gene_type:complete
MSAFKQFLSQDLTVEPFRVNKSFTFYGSQFASSVYDSAYYDTDFYSGDNTGINNDTLDRFIGIKGNFEFTQSLTGNDNNQYQVLIYDSIKELYYSNFLTSSYGSPVQTQSLFPGENIEGDVFVGNPDSSGRYENYLQSTDDTVRSFPTSSGERIFVLSIPSRLWGDYVQPGSFEYKLTDSDSITHLITDDGNGNLYTSGTYVGNIIYPHGIAVFTDLQDNNPPRPEGYGVSEYGDNFYGGGISIADLMSSNVTCSFSSSFDIYETQYKSTINEFEFNFSQNPSIISGSTDGTVYDFVTGSFFSPYVSTVGLYDDAQNLLAVGKLSQPLPISRTTDTTIFINIDR